MVWTGRPDLFCKPRHSAFGLGCLRRWMAYFANWIAYFSFPEGEITNINRIEIIKLLRQQRQTATTVTKILEACSELP